MVGYAAYRAETLGHGDLSSPLSFSRDLLQPMGVLACIISRLASSKISSSAIIVCAVSIL